MVLRNVITLLIRFKTRIRLVLSTTKIKEIYIVLLVMDREEEKEVGFGKSSFAILANKK